MTCWPQPPAHNDALRYSTLKPQATGKQRWRHGGVQRNYFEAYVVWQSCAVSLAVCL